MMSFLFGVFAALSVCAGEVITWTDYSGDHRWNNAANWDLNRTPDANGADIIRIPSGDWRIIRKGGTYKYDQFYIEDGTGTVTLDGAGIATTIYPIGTADFKLGAGRQLAVTDGVTIKFRHDIPFTNGVLKVQSGGGVTFEKNTTTACTIGGTARVFVEGGTFCDNTTQLYITNKAEVVVSGGLIQVQRYIVCGPDSPGEQGPLLRILGGTVWNNFSYAYTSRIYPGGRFENLGGTVLWGLGSDSSNEKLCSQIGDYSSGDYGFDSFLPQKGALLNLTSRDDCALSGVSHAGALFFNADAEHSFDGDIFATNTAAATVERPGFVAFGRLRTVGLTGGGRIYANGLMIRESTTANIDISALYLGSGGIVNVQNSKTHFHNDLLLGAWGDWHSESGANGYCTFGGDLTFDTLNCFDKTTKHTISVQAGFADVTSIKAIGGGTVELSSGNDKTPWPAQLYSITVGENTSLCITNSTIKTGSLSLEAGSTLTFDLASNRYFDVVHNMHIGSGARIVAKLPASFEAGKIYTVLVAPAGTEVSDGLVQLEGPLPSGWSLVRRANFLYLSDGEVSCTTPSTEFRRYWTGAVDGDVDKVDNWTTNEIPFTSGKPYRYAFAEFEGSKNLDVTIPGPRNAYGLNFRENAGPFIFTGEPINLFYTPDNHRAGGTSTYGGVMSNSDLPCIVNNDVTNEKGFYLALDYKSGSISLMGNPIHTSDTSDFYFCGDVRLGGAWNLSCFNVNTNSAALDAKCPHTLTLLSGASLVATKQDVQDFDRKQRFSLAPSSTLTIGGETCRFLEANTHFIDGTFTVNGTLDALAKQTFLGDGTNKFQSATGELDFKGNMMVVPGSLVGDVALSFKGEPTIAPETDWTFGGEAELELDGHSKLTLATGGNKLTFEKPIVSEGTLAVTGNGTVEIAAKGMSLDKVTMSDGAKFSLAANLDASERWVEVLKVREDDESIAFDVADPSMVRKVIGEDGCTTYFVKHEKGMMLIVR